MLAMEKEIEMFHIEIKEKKLGLSFAKLRRSYS
jgi:hypothetical protein